LHPGGGPLPGPRHPVLGGGGTPGRDLDGRRHHHGAFAESELLDFPLLADTDGSVAEAYGVRRRFVTPVKRATFVIDEHQQVIEVIQSETNMTAHADRALEVLARLA